MTATTHNMSFRTVPQSGDLLTGSTMSTWVAEAAKKPPKPLIKSGHRESITGVISVGVVETGEGWLAQIYVRDVLVAELPSLYKKGRRALRDARGYAYDQLAKMLTFSESYRAKSYPVDEYHPNHTKDTI